MHAFATPASPRRACFHLYHKGGVEGVNKTTFLTSPPFVSYLPRRLVLPATHIHVV